MEEVKDWRQKDQLGDCNKLKKDKNFKNVRLWYSISLGLIIVAEPLRRMNGRMNR